MRSTAGCYDRAAIFAKAWRDLRRVRAAGDESMCFGDWLKNAWRVAKAQRQRQACTRQSAVVIPRGTMVPAIANLNAATPDVRVRRFFAQEALLLASPRATAGALRL